MVILVFLWVKQWASLGREARLRNSWEIISELWMSSKWYIWEDIVDAVDAISKSCVGRLSHGRSAGQWHVEKTGEVVGGKSNGSVLRGAEINDEWWRTKCDKKNWWIGGGLGLSGGGMWKNLSRTGWGSSGQGGSHAIGHPCFQN